MTAKQAFKTNGFSKLTVVTVIASLAFIASACGSATKVSATNQKPKSSNHPASKTASNKSPSKSSTKAQSSSKAQGTSQSSSTVSVGRCRADELVVSLAGTEGAAGSIIRSYEFTNSGKTTCTLFGYPGLGLLGAQGQNLTTTVQREPAPESTVTLSPGGHAWFAIEYGDGTGYGNLTCPESSALEVTPPNAYHQLILKGAGGTIQAYGGTTSDLKCGLILIKPVTSTLQG
jgi:hypothetical protein